MKHTEKQIRTKAIGILKDINPQYFKEQNLTKILYDENDNVARPKGKTMPAWTVIINEPVFDTSIFLVISDETGEPLYIQNKHGVKEIKKGTDGTYKTIN